MSTGFNFPLLSEGAGQAAAQGGHVQNTASMGSLAPNCFLNQFSQTSVRQGRDQP